MTPSGEPPPFRVTSSELLRKQLLRWGEVAKRIGLGEEYAAAIRRIYDRLSNDPVGWGDPLFPLRQLKLIVYRGFDPVMYVSYGVHAQERVVFLRSFLLVPGHPLQRACEDEGLT
jgi:hypothetical protein